MRDYAIITMQETSEITMPTQGYERFPREMELCYKINELVGVVNSLAKIVNEYELERAKEIKE